MPFAIGVSGCDAQAEFVVGAGGGGGPGGAGAGGAGGGIFAGAGGAGAQDASGDANGEATGGWTFVGQDAADVNPDAPCGQTSVATTTKPVNILLVIDKSDSMKDTPAGFGSTKWSAVATALDAALAKVKGGLGFGLELFPYNSPDAGQNACAMPTTSAEAVQIPIGPGTVTVPEIHDALAAISPSGATPTAIALQRALEYFTTDAREDLVGDRYVLLATDGGPNCTATAPCDASACTINLDGKCPVPDGSTLNCCQGFNDSCLDSQSTLNAIGALAAAGIKTFVVGIPGSEVYHAQLDDFAVAGGMPASAVSPKYYRVNAAPDGGSGVDQLTAVFTAITQQLITSCRHQLKSEPPDYDLINVVVDGVQIPKLASAEAGRDGGDGGSVSGWTLDRSAMPTTVVIEGPVCDQIESQGASAIDVLYGCPSVTVF